MLTMRRFAIATLAGFALLAGQAAAANQGPDLRVGDRVGPTKGVSKRFAAVGAGASGPFGWTWGETAAVAGAIGLGAAVATGLLGDSSP